MRSPSTPPASTLDRWHERRASAIPFEPPPVPTLVVAPHPDDEVLLAGGLIAHLCRRGIEVTVVAVTDGEGAYPELPAPGLAALRRGEQRSAARELGVTRPIVRLGLPDGAVSAHEERLTTALHSIADTGLIVAPWWRDGHPDHDACGRAALAAGRANGVPVLGGLFWTWHWSPVEVLADQQLCSVALTDADRHARQRAMASHRSQTDPAATGRPVDAAVVLEPRHLTPLDWSEEIHVIDG